MIGEIKTCGYCKQEFATKRYTSAANPNKYCSVRCAGQGKRDESLREQRTCGYCRKTFTFYSVYAKSDPKANPGLYCSKKCADDACRATKRCAHCQCEFIVMLCMAEKRKYCSQACAGTKDRRTNKVCLRCGAAYDVINSQADTSRFCSFSCKVKHEGEKRRKPLVDPERPHARRLQSRAWREIREQVLQRDGWSCKRCGRDQGLEVHHIVAWRLSKDDSSSNLITLCKSCHQVIEPRGKYLAK